MSLRIWATVILGGFISLWILPVINRYIGLDWTLVPALVVIIVVFVSIGWFLNLLGLRSIEHLTSEAATWERIGAYRGAEEAFNKAAAVLDSYLLSPLLKRRVSTKLAARLARFYLARADNSLSSESFIITYLQSHPEDEEVAESWLQQIESRGGLKTDHYELANQIANAQPNNAIIQDLLARFYLSEGRTDFPALQTYRQVLTRLKNSGLKRDNDTYLNLVDNLAILFLRDERADEWALSVYLEAFKVSSEKQKLLRGIAVSVHCIRETERNKHLVQQAHRLLQGLDEMQLKKLRGSFSLQNLAATQSTSFAQAKVGFSLWKVVRHIGAILFHFITTSSSTIISGKRKFINLIKHSRRVASIIKWSIMIILIVGITLLLINTISHLIKTKKARYEKEKSAKTVVTDPFTLQVAAYLNQQDAERYVKYLQTKGLDVFWIKRIGKRKVWYQVRVSHFADKASARAYGKKLKALGIIDDFYVANYDRS